MVALLVKVSLRHHTQTNSAIKARVSRQQPSRKITGSLRNGDEPGSQPAAVSRPDFRSWNRNERARSDLTLFLAGRVSCTHWTPSFVLLLVY